MDNTTFAAALRGSVTNKVAGAVDGAVKAPQGDVTEDFTVFNATNQSLTLSFGHCNPDPALGVCPWDSQYTTPGDRLMYPGNQQWLDVVYYPTVDDVGTIYLNGADGSSISFDVKVDMWGIPSASLNPGAVGLTADVWIVKNPAHWIPVMNVKPA